MNLIQLNRLRQEQSTSFLKLFGTDLVLDLDPSIPSRLINNPSMSGNVAIYKEGSIYGNDCTQPTATVQPITGISSLNGLNTLDFNNDWMFLNPNLYNLPMGDSTIFTIVKKNTNTSFVRRIISLGISGTSYFDINVIESENTVSFRNGLVTAPSISGVPLNNYNLITCRRKGTEQYISVNNGVPVTNNNAVDVPGINEGKLCINSNGVGFVFTGNLAPMVIIKKACTDDEISFVNNKLMTRWLP